MSPKHLKRDFYTKYFPCKLADYRTYTPYFSLLHDIKISIICHTVNALGGALIVLVHQRYIYDIINTYDTVYVFALGQGQFCDFCITHSILKLTKIR